MFARRKLAQVEGAHAGNCGCETPSQLHSLWIRNRWHGSCAGFVFLQRKYWRSLNIL